jgi:flagellar protein FliL
MADVDLDAEDTGDNGEEKEPAKKKIGMKKMIILGVSGLIVLSIVGGGIAYMFGALDSMLGIEREKTKLEIELGVPASFPLPVIKADLKTGRCRAPFLKVEVVVLLNQNDLDKIEDKQVEVIDGVRAHLRDQERQDLAGKAGTDQLRFDLINVINKVIAPARVNGILFKDFLLQ